MIETPPDEIESTEEFVTRAEDVTRWDEWDEDEHIVPGTIRVRSVGLAVKEEREAQDEIFQRFSQAVLGNSSDSLRGSNSEGENECARHSEWGEDNAVQAMTGDGFQIVQEEELVPQWPKPKDQVERLANLLRIQRKEREMEAMIPEWMSKADRYMLDIDGKTPVPWEMFCDTASWSEDRIFSVLE
jgi:hypothetical protein